MYPRFADQGAAQLGEGGVAMTDQRPDHVSGQLRFILDDKNAHACRSGGIQRRLTFGNLKASKARGQQQFPAPTGLDPQASLDAGSPAPAVRMAGACTVNGPDAPHSPPRVGTRPAGWDP